MKHIPNLKFDDFQKGLLRDRYCLPGESISGMFKRVALAMEMPETQEIMQKGLFIPNSPTLYNAGTDIGQLSACFVLPIYDSMESIYGTLKDTAIIHKTGGGTGFNFSNLRPNGDRVGSHGGIASGVVSFMRVYDAGTEAVKQGGKRRGANMGMLDMWHPDIEDFMASKEGDNALQNFNLSNSITDDFMHAQQHDKDWDLINPRTGDTWKTVSAKELWDKMIHYAWKRGDPGVYFRDAVERANPTPELGDLRCCNPCVSGDTKVLTKEGYIPIINLIGREVEVWNGREWSLVKPEKTGEAQRLLKLTFTDGSSLRCTLYHPFYLETGEKVDAQDLIIGSSLEKWEMPVIEGSNFKLPEGMVPDWRYASGVRVCWLEAIIDKNRQIHADADTLRIIKEHVLDITGYHCTLYADKGYIQIREPINMQVIGIEDGGVEDVYCFNEPIRHRGIFNGICTGQCVSADTVILTRTGYEPIGELVGQKVEVWNGEEFSEVIPKITGENQPMLYFEFSNGHAIRCTPYHGFLLKDGTRVEAKDLKVLDQLARWEYPVIEGTEKASEELMYTKGFFSGDGTKMGRRCSIRLYGSKRDLNLEQFLLYTHISYREEFTNLELDSDAGFEKEWVPGVEYTVQARLDWLAGLMDSDGGSSGHGIYISSVNLGFLQQVQYMCETLGCSAILSEGKKPCTKEFKGKEYPCQQEYRLVFSWWETSKLRELGFRTHRIRIPEGKPQRDNSHYVTCVFKEDSGIEDKVYCFTEPLKHMGVFNGLHTFNCGETPLRDNESCNLGSINLSRMVDKHGDFDYDLMEQITRTAVEFLNQVVIKNKYPLPQIEQATLETKKIGLGIMGWADALLLMGVYYDSTEALDIAEHVMEFVNDIAHDQSAGRNATVTTIAPTGSISIIANCSSGIEPNFGLYEVREQAGRTYHRKHPLVGQVDEGLFRLSHDVSPEYHIFHQATFQRFTDNAISKTINLPNNATEDMIAYAINLAHKLECKGTTIYRDKSKSKQVITKECEKCQA